MKYFVAFFLVSAFLVQSAYASRGKVRTIRLNDKTVATIPISTKGAILNFPTKPTNVILGAKNSFAIDYVKSDLAISPMTSASRSNLFVYLDGRRFNFDLVASRSGYSLVVIKDSADSLVRVKNE